MRARLMVGTVARFVVAKYRAHHQRRSTGGGFQIYTAGNGGGVNGGGLPGATSGACAGTEYKAALKG